MKRQGEKVLQFIGLLGLVYWFLDFLNIVFLLKQPQYLLWFSSLGLLMTSIALIKNNVKFITILFCSLFVIESVWTLDLAANILFKRELFGITNYLFDPPYTQKDRIMTMYHALIPVMLVAGVVQSKKIYHLGWLGALLYTVLIVVVTFLTTDKSLSVNCISNSGLCQNAFSPIFSLTEPYNVISGLALLVLFVFVPSQLLLTKIAKISHWRIV